VGTAHPYRHRSEPPPNLPPTNHSPGAASGTSHFFRVLAYGEKHRSIFIVSADILVASDTESVIQKTCGHDSLSSLIDFSILKEENLIVHKRSRAKVRKFRMNQNCQPFRESLQHQPYFVLCTEHPTPQGPWACPPTRSKYPKPHNRLKYHSR